MYRDANRHASSSEQPHYSPRLGRVVVADQRTGRGLQLFILVGTFERDVLVLDRNLQDRPHGIVR